MNEPSSIQILEHAISDVGYWRHWVPGEESLQLEFGGTQIYTASDDASTPPSGLVAVRLNNPIVAVALTRSLFEDNPPADWYRRLGADQIEPFTVDCDSFTLSNRDQLALIVEASSSQQWIIGGSSDLLGNMSKPLIAFWAQNVGFVALAESVLFLTMSGELREQDIEPRNAQWWDYWSEYWRRLDTEDPMPEDYACEVTIPAG